jgi:hypothetical protein
MAERYGAETTVTGLGGKAGLRPVRRPSDHHGGERDPFSGDGDPVRTALDPKPSSNHTDELAAWVVIRAFAW